MGLGFPQRPLRLISTRWGWALNVDEPRGTREGKVWGQTFCRHQPTASPEGQNSQRDPHSTITHCSQSPACSHGTHPPGGQVQPTSPQLPRDGLAARSISILRKVRACLRQHLDSSSPTKKPTLGFFFETNVFYKSLGFERKEKKSHAQHRKHSRYHGSDHIYRAIFSSCFRERGSSAKQSTQPSLEHLMFFCPLPLQMMSVSIFVNQCSLKL